MVATEKRLLQTIDMVIVKKKRIALTKRGNKMKGDHPDAGNSSWWGMLKTVTTVGRNSGESILSLLNRQTSIEKEN